MHIDASQVWSKEQYLQAFEASEDKSVANFARLHGISAEKLHIWLRNRARPALRRYVMLTEQEKDLLIALANQLDDPSPVKLREAWRQLRGLGPNDPCPSETSIRDLFKARGLTPNGLCPQPDPVSTFKRPELAEPKPAPTPEDIDLQREALKQTRYQPRHRAEPQETLGQVYPSDLTHEQWALIAPHLLKSNGRRIENAREKVNAIFYLMRTGCQWRYLPRDFPNWKTVYSLFRDMSHDGRWEKLNDVLRSMDRAQAGRAQESTVVIIDTQSVKTGEKGGSMAMTPTRRSTGASVC